MSPRSLLFSSDQETLRQLGQTLKELNLEVETSSEIFAALKCLTSKTFSVLAVDWDEGLEASFLLKTARESKNNQNIFAIVVGKADARAALEHAGADLVLGKPLQLDRARHALMTCAEFTRRQKNSLPTVETAKPHIVPPQPKSWPTPPRAKAVPGWPEPKWPESRLPEPRSPEARRPEPPSFTLAPAPAPRVAVKDISPPVVEPASIEAPVHLSFATFEDGLTGDSLFQRTVTRVREVIPFDRHKVLFRSGLMGIMFFAVGYTFSQPLSNMTLAVARAISGGSPHIQAIDRPVPQAPEMAAIPSDVIPQESHRITDHPENIHVSPAHASLVESAQPLSDLPQPVAQTAALQEPAPSPAATASAPEDYRPSIPASLGAPFPGVAAVREVASKVTPALSDALRPVSISGALSEKLLLEKIMPSYPEKALQAGLRGPVVLQAWIGKDGKIEELKLIRGPLLLGQAAFDAVRNWRYRPYLLNGEAVEAQTQVTVDFKLP